MLLFYYENIFIEYSQGRTGLMICAYLIYEYGYNTDSALSYYANERTKDSKVRNFYSITCYRKLLIIDFNF